MQIVREQVFGILENNITVQNIFFCFHAASHLQQETETDFQLLLILRISDKFVISPIDCLCGGF